MRIVTARRISQGFFLALFVWLCVVSTAGERWWQWRGWPVNWLLQLDPLVALATVLTTGALAAGLLWALASIVLTVLLGRFFCGWLCPFGTIHQAAGWLARRRMKLAERIHGNRYRRAQVLKYYILIFLLTAAAGSLLARAIQAPRNQPGVLVVAAGLALLALAAGRKALIRPLRALAMVLAALAAWAAAGLLLPTAGLLAASLHSGLLDPIPLVSRSINLAVLAVADSPAQVLSPAQRYYEGAAWIGAILLAAVFLNAWIPRFYCRFVCPLGALFGVLGRWALWRIGQKPGPCMNCQLCSRHCEGACEPGGEFRAAECVLCMNCLGDCRHGLVGYRTTRSAAGEIASPDVSRRGVLLSLVGGLAAAPLLRLAGRDAANWNPAIIRPPGALAEEQFLRRCIKCGQCMRVCPTNVLQPAGWQGGLEALWTPVLNNRIGTSGCQLNCVACGMICPTGAIRPLSPAEKLGRGPYEQAGPVRLGLAFVDRSRCLPWVLDKPCIVCQENCPVSPKAIMLEQKFIVQASVVARAAEGATIEIDNEPLPPGKYGSGDYYLRPAEAGSLRCLIVQNTERSITVAAPSGWQEPEGGTSLEIQLHLQLPRVDPKACIGCGVCEHECPISGLRAIRVTAENESRDGRHAMLL